MEKSSIGNGLAYWPSFIKVLISVLFKNKLEGNYDTKSVKVDIKDF